MDVGVGPGMGADVINIQLIGQGTAWVPASNSRTVSVSGDPRLPGSISSTTTYTFTLSADGVIR
jgi:hypothetical protein